MSPDLKSKSDPKIVAAQAFVRSLNILLKYARLCGFEHARTASQQETTWFELRAAVPPDNPSGLTATSERHLSPGTLLALKLNSGLCPLRAQVIVRNARTQAIAFEVVDIDLEDRSKLRRLLLELKGSTVEASVGAPANPAAAAG